MDNINKYKSEYSVTDVPNVWSVLFISEESAMFDHIGYVFSDEAGLFSLNVYHTKEAAHAALIKYEEGLNQMKPEDNEF